MRSNYGLACNAFYVFFFFSFVYRSQLHICVYTYCDVHLKDEEIKVQ